MFKIYLTAFVLLCSYTCGYCQCLYDNYTICNNDDYFRNNEDYYEDIYRTRNTNKTGILSRIKNILSGELTGFTPQIEEPSSYINTYGPSYMRGFYGSSGWNDHNSYNPIYSGTKLNILD